MAELLGGAGASAAGPGRAGPGLRGRVGGAGPARGALPAAAALARPQPRGHPARLARLRRRCHRALLPPRYGPARAARPGAFPGPAAAARPELSARCDGRCRRGPAAAKAPGFPALGPTGRAELCPLRPGNGLLVSGPPEAAWPSWVLLKQPPARLRIEDPSVCIRPTGEGLDSLDPSRGPGPSRLDACCRARAWEARMEGPQMAPHISLPGKVQAPSL